MWKSKMAGGGGNKQRFQYFTDSSGQEILYLRDLQGHSGRNPIDPTLQDNVLIPDNVFAYIGHIGCAISLHSITNSGLIAGGQNSSRERQTEFFTAVNPMNKKTQGSARVWSDQTRSCIVQAESGKGTRIRCTGSIDIQLAQHKGLKFYQTRSNAIILYGTLPAYCFSKAIVMKSEESYTRRFWCHLDHHRNVLTNMIGCVIWILISLEAAKVTNESNQHRIIKYGKTRMWAKVHKGNRETYYVWSRHS